MENPTKEQQKHLKQFVEQRDGLVSEVNDLTAQINTKKELLFKIQGIVEYLEQTGVTMPEESEEETEE